MAKNVIETGKLVVGLDIGYSNLKLAYGFKGGAEPTVIVKPAQAAPITQMPTGYEDGSARREGEYRVLVDGQPWIACIDPGRSSGMQRQLHEDFTSSDVYKALFHASLIEACQEGDIIDVLVTGLPVSHNRNRAMREALIDRLKGEHQVAAARKITVKEVIVLAQPVGTFVDVFSYHEDGAAFNESSVLVLDPGFFSLDWVLFVNGELVESSSNSSLKAMSVMLDAVNEEIIKDLGGSPGTEKLEIALQQGKTTIRLFGKVVELEMYLQRAAARIAPAALEEVRRDMRFLAGKELDFLVGGGGGGTFYMDAAKEVYPKTQPIISDSPVTSNATGFFWYGVDKAV
ncbi:MULTISPECIES: ParM/StbA family protein [Pseudomonas]|uniref:ParM/StbA family protein n=1 Tax=Pseudomonas TaxID=286 RepID=UPI00084AB7A9|nr:ParM/StbA family protein [Pseudomonas sp. AP19]OEC66343.1 hypothetical protein A7D21_28975 [Pseudomonas sp. AP19]